ncbi:MAG: class D sortase [Actinomycetia bacterium]|nr:class D sortase [Actinomycetes bacterium]
MLKEKWSRGRRSLAVGLSLGALALGFGVVWWASMNIGAPSGEPINAYQSPASSETASATGQATTAEDGVALPGSDAPSQNPDSDEVVYREYPAVGDTVGSLTIPALKQTLPIIEGTGAKELKRGVGHFTQSVLPGVRDNCVLSGHRDTVFTGLGKLKVGDQLVVETSAGSFTYQIVRTRIVDKDDKTVIVPADHAVLTVTTCYPFNYVGSAPNRYILVANLVTNQ